MKLRRRLRSPRRLTTTAALVALAAPIVHAGAAQALIVRHLRAEGVNSAAIPFSLPSGPRSLPLRAPNPAAYAASKAKAERGYLAWIARHPQASSGTSRTLAPRTATPFAPAPKAVLFEGLNQAGMLGGGTNTSATPPDTTGAIGPNDYVEIVNSEIAVYNRATLALEKSMGEAQFVNSTATCDGQIRWDQQAERWEYAVLDCGLTGTEGFSFGWSKTADPTNLEGGWCKYHVKTGKQLFDFPKLGGDNDFMMVGVNAYEAGAKPAENYVGSGVAVIEKPAKGRSTCPSEFGFGVEALPMFTPVPANVYGNSSTGYVVAAEYAGSGSANNLEVFTVTKNANGEPEFHEQPEVAVSTYYMPAPVPQPGSTDTIDSSDTRLTQAVADENPNTHQMQVWTQHTVAPSLGSPSVVAWYAVKAGAATPVQAGDVEAPASGNFAFDGAISPTARGNGAVIHYATGGAALKVEVHAQSHTPMTPAGQMENDVKLAESEDVDKDFSCPGISGEAAPCRWGDYAGASPDPLHQAVVWGTSQVNGPQETEHNNSQWKTRNFALGLRSQLPTAAFSVATPEPTGGAPVEFDASTSSDPAGEEIVTYEWSFGDGASATGQKPKHTYSLPGKYTVTLTVMDNAGLSNTVEHEATVADSPPTASFSASPPSPATGEAVTFDGSASRDSDGTIVSYEWSFGDGSPAQTGSAATVSHTYSSPGTHHVVLTVTDDKGLIDTSEQDVTVDAPPVASFVVASPSPTATEPIQFDGSSSSDPDGTVSGYRWSFGDGSTAEGATPSHTYAAAGQYTVTLTVTDNAGKSSSVSHAVTVADVPPSASGTSGSTKASVPDASSSNVFQVLSVKPNKKDGSALITVNVPGPGTLSARDASSARVSLFSTIAGALAEWQAPTAHSAKSKRRNPKTVALVKPVSATASAATSLTLKLAPTPAALKQLSRKHKLSVTVTLTFTPTGGTPATKTQPVVLQKVRSKPKRRHK